MTPPRILPVEPIGTRTGGAFVTRATGCGIEQVTTNVYPPSPQGDRLRDARLDARLTLGQTARLLGLAPVDVSNLENGKATFADAARWDAVIDVLRRSKESR